MENIWEDAATSFYRIIMPSVIREHRLVFPRNFVAGYGDELASNVKLYLPIGASWHIGLKRSAHLLCLVEGWEKFMKHHSVHVGYFLLFKYKGNSEFDVHIFDLTATEIQYPLRCNADMSSCTNKHALGKERSCGVATKEEDDNADILVAGSRTRLPKRKPFAESLGRKARDKVQKVMFTRSKRALGKERCHGIANKEEDYTADTLVAGSRRLFSKRKPFPESIVGKAPKRAQRLMLHQQNANSRGLTSPSPKGTNVRLLQCDSAQNPNLDQVEDKALYAATMYKTDNPSFISRMSDNNVKSSILNMPTQFSREHLQCCSEYVELQDSNNKKWIVRLIKNHNRPRMTLSKGWSKFVKKKGLKIGDVCVFELIQSSGIFKVSVFHAQR